MHDVVTFCGWCVVLVVMVLLLKHAPSSWREGSVAKAEAMARKEELLELQRQNAESAELSRERLLQSEREIAVLQAFRHYVQENRSVNDLAVLAIVDETHEDVGFVLEVFDKIMGAIWPMQS